ncbi:helix-turn-helix domain-containing protein [Clostridia bacterium OttesenSCG-928-F22]|nr:helix-turn-helix domain-containing protein [Clostridia bacterium OttesenSCG-928-F22]
MKTINYLQIGQTIKELRTNAGFTQEQMAEKCNISTSFLGHIERGSRKLSLETAIKIADCLNVSLDSLIITGRSDDNVLPSISAILQKQSKEKQEQFIRTVKVLAENIDKI